MENIIKKLVFIALLVPVFFSCEEKTVEKDEKEIIKPPARGEHRIAITESNNLILFGGSSGSVIYNDTWEFDIETYTWEEVNIIGAIPPKRSRFAMAYGGDSKVILFGGDFDGDIDYLNDTWEYDVQNNNWTEHNKTGLKPSARKHADMVYIGNNKIILYGGMDEEFNQLDDTWEYNAINHEWKKLDIKGSNPSERVSIAMSLIENSNIIQFGGSSFGGIEIEYNETWIYNINDTTWNLKEPVGQVPPGRHEPALFSAGGSKILLYGGNHIGGERYLSFGDTWEYDLETNTWTEYNTTGISPPISVASEMVKINENIIILHGGGGSEIGDQTWEYNLINHSWNRII